MKQTAVEWLIENLQAPCRGIPSHIIDRAKEMEKEQIVGAYLEGDRNGFTRYKSYNVEQRTSEQYYNETYNK